MQCRRVQCISPISLNNQTLLCCQDEVILFTVNNSRVIMGFNWKKKKEKLWQPDDARAFSILHCIDTFREKYIPKLNICCWKSLSDCHVFKSWTFNANIFINIGTTSVEKGKNDCLTLSSPLGIRAFQSALRACCNWTYISRSRIVKSDQKFTLLCCFCTSVNEKPTCW